VKVKRPRHLAAIRSDTGVLRETGASLLKHLAALKDDTKTAREDAAKVRGELRDHGDAVLAALAGLRSRIEEVAVHAQTAAGRPACACTADSAAAAPAVSVTASDGVTVTDPPAATADPAAGDADPAPANGAKAAARKPRAKA